MASTVFVENLGGSVTAADLTEHLSEHGTIESIELAKDDGSDDGGQVAFITMRNTKQGRAVIAALNGQTYGERVLKAKAMKRGGGLASAGSSSGPAGMGSGRRGVFSGGGGAYGHKGRGKAGGRNR